MYVGYVLTTGLGERLKRRRIVYRFDADNASGEAVCVRRRDLHFARLGDGDAGLELHFHRIRTDRGPGSPLVVRGDAARMVLGRAMVDVNIGGAGPRELDAALAAIRSAGSPEALLLQAGRQELAVTGARGAPLRFRDLLVVDWSFWSQPVIGFDPSRTVRPGAPNPLMSLAMEIALHEETERRALGGELAALEAMWREAEEIAVIADRLPDVPPPEPPRVDAG